MDLGSDGLARMPNFASNPCPCKMERIIAFLHHSEIKLKASNQSSGAYELTQRIAHWGPRCVSAACFCVPPSVRFQGLAITVTIRDLLMEFTYPRCFKHRASGAQNGTPGRKAHSMHVAASADWSVDHVRPACWRASAGILRQIP